MLEWFYLGYLGQEVVGRLPPVIGETEIDLLGLYKLVDDLGGYMNVEFNNHWSDVANMLGLTLEDKEAIKECYKEFIGMMPFAGTHITILWDMENVKPSNATSFSSAQTLLDLLQHRFPEKQQAD
nr:bulb-type lectin domain-containing protein [Tanacetum cinerariifolium]